MGIPPYKEYPGGGTTVDQLVSISLETATAARGTQCLRVKNYTPARGLETPDRVSSAPSSFHSNFFFIDDFDDDDTLFYKWRASVSMFAYYEPLGVDYSEYNLLSFYAKASGSFNFTVWFEDDDGVMSYPFSTTPTNNYWKRMDAEIGWGDCDPTQVYWLKILVNGPSYTNLWIDDVVLIDKRPETNKENWIDLNLFDYDVSMDGNLINVPTPGYGDVVYSSNPSLQRGNLQYITHAPQDDNDLEFVEQFARRGTRLYLRCAYEGTPIYITENRATSQGTYFGVQRRIQTRFVEDG
jgi:hypothetical protein